MGLRQDIVQAKTEKEVMDLLTKSTLFQYATPRTKASWKYTSQRTLSKLSPSSKVSMVDAANVVEVKQSEIAVSVKKNKYKKNRKI